MVGGVARLYSGHSLWPGLRVDQENGRSTLFGHYRSKSEQDIIIKNAIKMLEDDGWFPAFFMIDKSGSELAALEEGAAFALFILVSLTYFRQYFPAF